MTTLREIFIDDESTVISKGGEKTTYWVDRDLVDIAEAAIRADEAAKSAAEIERLTRKIQRLRIIIPALSLEPDAQESLFSWLDDDEDYEAEDDNDDDDPRVDAALAGLRDGLGLPPIDAAAPTPEPGPEPELNNDEEELDEGWDRIAEAIVKFAPAPTDDEPEEEIAKCRVHVVGGVAEILNEQGQIIGRVERMGDTFPPAPTDDEPEDDPLAGIPQAESIADCVRMAFATDEPINEFAVYKRLDALESFQIDTNDAFTLSIEEMGKLDKRLDDQEQRVLGLTALYDGLAVRLDGHERRLVDHLKRIAYAHELIDLREKNVGNAWEAINAMGRRIDALEAAPAQPVVTDEMVDAGRAFWEKTFEEVISTRHMWNLLEAALAASGESDHA